MYSPLTLAARALQIKLAGDVSKNALLTVLLPLSFASLFGTLITAAVFFPDGYDWRVRAISALTSPRDNPEGCWLPAIGIMAAMLLALPFAGYVALRLRANTPRLAGSAGWAFAFGFGLMILAIAAQLAQPVIGLRWLHQNLAGTSAVSFIVGMFCCCACALEERRRRFGGQRSLSAGLVRYWVSLTLLPIGCLASLGVLMLLGRYAGQTWAEDFRQSFRHTPLWQLAFWEWIGAVMTFAFLAGSVLLLPGSCGARRTSSGRAATPAEARADSLFRGPRRAP